MIQNQAIALAATKWWEKLSLKEVAQLQANEPLLCMPFSQFHAAVEAHLNRAVFTHEFIEPSLKEEVNAHDPIPIFDALLAAHHL